MPVRSRPFGLLLGLLPLCMTVGAAAPAAEKAAPAKAATRAVAAAAAPAAPAAAATEVTEKPLSARATMAQPLAIKAQEFDSIGRLRARLAERMVIDKAASEGAGQLELHIKGKAMGSAGSNHGSAAGLGKAKSRPASQRAAGSHEGTKHALHWSYAGDGGPTSWGALRPDFHLCAKGQRQSPVDIQAGLSVELEPVKFEYKASRFGVIDNGHTVQANLAAGNFIELGGVRYELQQFHFHRPSEERIDGRQFEMSLHLVHKDAQGRLAVVALLLDRGSPHAAVQKVWNNLPLEKQQEAPASLPLDLDQLLPADQRYFTYMGSLTTPPCSEGVRWVVMRQPVQVSQEQIELFARLYPMNARPVQQLAGRRILQSQ